MIRLGHGQIYNWQEAVVEKYGKERLEKVISDAQTAFWITIHNEFLGDTPDGSRIDIDETLVGAVLDYIYENDADLSAD